MAFNATAGHEFFLQYATDSGVVNESTGAITESFGSWTDIGYTSPANVVSTDNNSSGFAAGRRTASYHRKGRREHSLTADLRIGSATQIKALYDATSYFAWRWGADNVWADRLRQGVVSTMAFAASEEQGELTAQAVIEAIAREDAITAVNPNYSFEQFGAVLFWQNVMGFTIGGSPFRDILSGFTINVDNQIERKGMRPDWGDDAPMSRTPYALMYHHKAITGSLNFHDRLAASLFTSADDSTDWGSLVFTCNDTSAGGSKIFNMTLTNVRPVSRTQQGVGSEAQMAFGVEFVADDMTIAIA
jgi:hypothetical protein